MGNELKSPKWIIAKGLLFLLAGGLACAIAILRYPTLELAILLGLAIWCFARFYYFAFYVIEHYVDASYRFAGLLSAFRYLIGRYRTKRSESVSDD